MFNQGDYVKFLWSNANHITIGVLNWSIERDSGYQWGSVFNISWHGLASTFWIKSS